MTGLLNNAAKLVAFIRPGPAIGQGRSEDGQHKEAMVRSHLRAEYSTLFEQDLIQSNSRSYKASSR